MKAFSIVCYVIGALQLVSIFMTLARFGEIMPEQAKLLPVSIGLIVLVAYLSKRAKDDQNKETEKDEWLNKK